jgi:uncharacterized paraquat-inducible protein A
MKNQAKVRLENCSACGQQMDVTGWPRSEYAICPRCGRKKLVLSDWAEWRENVFCSLATWAIVAIFCALAGLVLWDLHTRGLRSIVMPIWVLPGISCDF